MPKRRERPDWGWSKPKPEPEPPSNIWRPGYGFVIDLDKCANWAEGWKYYPDDLD